MKRFLLFALVAFVLTHATYANAQATSTPKEPQTIRIEPAGVLKLEAGAGPSWWTYLVPIVGPIVSGLIAFGGAWLGLRNAESNTRRTLEAAQRNNDAAIWQKANETELDSIQAKLDGFYIPFQLLSKANLQFAQDLRSRQGPDYRLLLKLFDKEWREKLSPGDRKLVEIICGNGEQLRSLISEKSGLVNDKILPYLSRASAHFRILNLARERELGEQADPFKDYVYPRELDDVLELEIARLRRRIEQLRANPGSRPQPFEPLVIPPMLQLREWARGGPLRSG